MQSAQYNRKFSSIKLEDEDTSIKLQLLTLLRENASLDPRKPSKYPNSGIKLEVKTRAKPFWTRQYPIPRIKQESMNKVIEKWIENDIVSRCTEGSKYNPLYS